MIIDNETYDILTRQGESVGLTMALAEAHGLVCGMLAAHVNEFERVWKDEVFSELNEEDDALAEFQEGMQNLVDSTAREFTSGEGMLTLVLPADTQPIAERATGIRDWSSGFLYGYGLAGKQSEATLSDEAGEAIRDFSEISRMETSEFDEEQSAEEALLQLEEYLWVAALLIWHDIGNKNT